MKTIVEGKTNITKILGKQHVKNTEYRLMNYVLQNKCKDGVLLHNAITGQMVLLSEEEAYCLSRLPIKPVGTILPLIEDYFIVPIDYDEKVTVDKLRFLLNRILVPKGKNSYVIFTTTRCNARCYYCFESEYSRINMEVATCDRVVEYMIGHKDKDPLRISWFGGEPLVGIDCIDHICNKLRENNIDYTSDMTSNGYLFTEDVIKRAVDEWKLRSVQITLDGTETIYNRTKAYVSTEGSPYQRVIRNIKMLLDYGVHVQIRLNLTQDNAEDIETLIGELKQKFDECKNLYVYVHAVLKDLGFSPIRRNMEEENALYRKQVEIDRELTRLGLSKHNPKLPSLKIGACMADNDGALAIYPDGKLFKCQHINEEEVAGSIDTEEFDEHVLDVFREQLVEEGCFSCPLFPTCLLLKRCPGREKPNLILCDYDLEWRRRAMLTNYARLREADASERSSNSLIYEGGAKCT